MIERMTRRRLFALAAMWGAFGPWTAAAEYMVDAAQRSILFWDVLRQRGEPPGARASSALVAPYGSVVRTLRTITTRTVDKEPKWRRPGRELTTGAGRSW